MKIKKKEKKTKERRQKGAGRRVNRKKERKKESENVAVRKERKSFVFLHYDNKKNQKARGFTVYYLCIGRE